MKYKLEVNGVEDTETGTIIPNDANNPDWQAYELWANSGNTPDPEFSDTEIETKRVKDIKTNAGKKIVEIMPEWKQRNSLARVLELLALVTDLTALPADDQAELADALAEWDNLKAIRATSDDAETNGTNPEDVVW